MENEKIRDVNFDIVIFTLNFRYFTTLLRLNVDLVSHPVRNGWVEWIYNS